MAEADRGQFGFWVGSWLVRSEAGEEVDGTNEIRWVLDGAVLEERFSAGADPFVGRSYSVPVAGRGWRQTWVDNAGTYLDFAGGWLGDRMVLERAVDAPGPAVQRMTWYEITADSLLWDWAFWTDPGPWELRWRLRYERRTPPPVV